METEHTKKKTTRRKYADLSGMSEEERANRRRMQQTESRKRLYWSNPEKYRKEARERYHRKKAQGLPVKEPRTEEDKKIAHLRYMEKRVEILAKAKADYANNPEYRERKLANAKRWQANHPGYVREYRAKHKAEVSVYNQTYYKKRKTMEQ